MASLTFKKVAKDLTGTKITFTPVYATPEEMGRLEVRINPCTDGWDCKQDYTFFELNPTECMEVLNVIRDGGEKMITHDGSAITKFYIDRRIGGAVIAIRKRYFDKEIERTIKLNYDEIRLLELSVAGVLYKMVFG